MSDIDESAAGDVDEVEAKLGTKARWQIARELVRASGCGDPRSPLLHRDIKSAAWALLKSPALRAFAKSLPD